MKEKMKSILFVLALALVFVGATKVTEAAAAEEKKAYDINYAEERVEISAASGSVYYQVVTKTDLSKVKETNWVPAANADGEAWIDFSALSNTKDCYIVYSNSKTAKGSELTEANLITIPAKVKSFKATLKYETETVTSGGIYDVIASLDVKGVAKGGADDFKTTSETLKDKALNQIVVLGWKRGANGNWKVASEFKTVDWEMMKASNTTLYLRIEKADKDGANDFDVFRYSKEAKIKVPKTAKAPTIKIDYKKQTVAIKSGMEFRKEGDSTWIKVAVKKNGGGEDVFDIEKGLAKAVSSLTLDQIEQKITVASGTAYNIEVRTAATTSKFASNVKTVEIVPPAAAPAAAKDAAKNVMIYTPAVAASASGAAVAASLTIDLSKAVDGIDATYEYALVGDDYDITKVKFTKYPNKVINLSSKIKTNAAATVTYNKASGTGTVEYLKASIIIRKAANTAKGSEAFASEVLTIKPEISK